MGAATLGTGIGRLLCTGIRGARPGDPVLERDLDACLEAGVGGVVLFDVDLPTFNALISEGSAREQALSRAERNILDPDQLAELTRHLRKRLGDRVLLCIDQEGGQVARLSPRRGFPQEPSAAEFAASASHERSELARAQARRLRELGIDLNFAPCVDLALEAENEIIVAKGRSFGKDPSRVIEAAQCVLEAHAAEGLAACLKHFPGHGSARGDTHRGIVDITASWQREAELQPYRELLGAPGVAVMVGHLLHRGIDPARPASLSRSFIQELLRGELAFDGLVITDSIDMRAVADTTGPPEAAVAALDAGADWVVDAFNLEARPEHPAPALADTLRRAREDGRLDEERIRASLARLDALRQSGSASRRS